MQEFKNVTIGQKFFDPNSGEDWQKISESSAMIISGGDYLRGNCDNFAPDDMVQRLAFTRYMVMD